MEVYAISWKRFADFTGRSSRIEYWVWVLVNTVISGLLAFIDQPDLEAEEIGTLSVVFLLAVFIPTLALSARRLHDFGQSGWLTLLLFVPLIGFISWIYFGVKAGNPEVNKFGAPSRFAPNADAA